MAYHDLLGFHTFNTCQLDVVFVQLVDHITSGPQCVPCDGTHRQTYDWQDARWTRVSGRVHRRQTQHTRTENQYQRVGYQRWYRVYKDGVNRTDVVRHLIFVSSLDNTDQYTHYHGNTNRDNTHSHRDLELVTDYFNNRYTVLNTSGFAEVQTDNVAVEIHQLFWNRVQKSSCQQLFLLLLFCKFHQLFFCEIVVGRKQSQQQEYDCNNDQYCYKGFQQSFDGIFKHCYSTPEFYYCSEENAAICSATPFSSLV